ncbi:uncharacterized protein [Littorina saxatilis]|uniref:uncharacterized protein n=1 Tax=Littorina saxatilis TaxID=31220 RepID=UPI0038B457FA
MWSLAELLQFKGNVESLLQSKCSLQNHIDELRDEIKAQSDSGARGSRNISPGSSVGPTEERKGIMRDSSFGPKRVLISDSKPTASRDAFTNTVLTRGSRSKSTPSRASADPGTTPRGVAEEGNKSSAIRESAEKPYSPTPSPRMQKQASLAEAWGQGLQREASASQTVPNQDTPEQPCTPSAVNSQGFDACSTCQRPLAECSCMLRSENNNSDRWPDDEGLPESPRNGQALFHQRPANDWHAGASRQPYTLNPREHPIDYESSSPSGRSQRSRFQAQDYEDHSRHNAGFTSNGRNPLRQRLMFEDDIQRYVNEPVQVKRVKGVHKSESFYEDEVETFPTSNREKRRGTMNTRTEYDEEFETLPSLQSDGVHHPRTQPTSVDIPVDHIPESQPSPQRVDRNPRDAEEVRVVKEWDGSNRVEIPVAHIPEPQPSPQRVCRKPRNAERVHAVSYTTKKEWDGSTTSQSYIDEEVLECPTSRKIKSREVKFTQREEPCGVVLEPEPEIYYLEQSLVEHPSTSDYEEEEPVLEGSDSPPRKRSRVAPPGSACPRPSHACARISWSPPCLNRAPLRRNSHHYCGYNSEGPQGCVCNSRSAHSFGKDSTRPYCIVCESATTQNLEPGAEKESRNKDFHPSSARQGTCRPWGSHSSTRDTMCRRDQAAAMKSQTTHCREMPTGDSPESSDRLSPHQVNSRRSSVRDRWQNEDRVSDRFPEDVRDASFEQRSDCNRLSSAPSATLRSPREVIQNVPNEGSWEEFTASGKRLPPPVTPEELMALKNRKKKQARESLCEPDEPSLQAAIRKAQRHGSFMYPKKHDCGIARKSWTPVPQTKPRTKKRKSSTPCSEVNSTHFSRWASPPELIRKERTPNNRRASSASPVWHTDERGISLSRIRSRSEAPDDSTRRLLQSRIERSHRSLTVSRCSPEESSYLDEEPDFVDEDPMQELQVVPYQNNQAAPKSPKSSRAETHGRNDAPQMHNAGLPQVEIRIAINSPPPFTNATPHPRRVSPSPSATCVTAANTDFKDRASPVSVEVLDSISGTRQVAKFGPANVISVQPARRNPLSVQVLDADDGNMQGVTRNNAQYQQHEEQVQYCPSEDFPFSQFMSGGEQQEPGIFVGVMIRRKETNCCHPQNREEKTAEDGANKCCMMRDACVGTDRQHGHDIQDLAAAVMESIPNFDFSQQPFVMTIESETLVTERGGPIEDSTCMMGGNYLGQEQVSGSRRSSDMKESFDVTGRTTSESNGNYPNYEPGYHVEMVPSDLDPGKETTQGATVHRYSPPTRDTEGRGRPRLCEQNVVDLCEEVLSDDFKPDSPPRKTFMVKKKPLGRKTVDVGTETDPCFGVKPCISPLGTRRRSLQEKKRVKIDGDPLSTDPNGRKSAPGAPAGDKVCCPKCQSPPLIPTQQTDDEALNLKSFLEEQEDGSTSKGIPAAPARDTTSCPKCRSPPQIPTRQADDEALNLKSFLEEQEDGSTSKGIPAAPARDTTSCPKCRSPPQIPTRHADDEALNLKSFLEEQEDGSTSKGIPAAPARDTTSCPKCRSPPQIPTRQTDDDALKLKSFPEEQVDSSTSKPMSKSSSGDRRYSEPAMKLQELGTSEEKTCSSCRSVFKDAAHTTPKRRRIQSLPADLRNISQTSEEEEHILNSSAVDEGEEAERSLDRQTILSVRPSLLARRLESLSRQAPEDEEYDMDSSIPEEGEDSDDSPSSEKAEQMPTRVRAHSLPTTSHAKKYEKGSDRHSQKSTERDKHACPNHIHEDTVDFRANGRVRTLAHSATAPESMRQPNQESPDRPRGRSHSISSSFGATKSEQIPRGRAKSLCSSQGSEKSEQITRLAMRPSVNEPVCSATKEVKQILTRERIQSPTRSRQDADDPECSSCQRRSRSTTTDASRPREQNTRRKIKKQDSVHSHEPEPLVSYDPDKVHGIETEDTDVDEITRDAEDEVPRKTFSNIVIFTPYPVSQFAQPSPATTDVHETSTSPNAREHTAPPGQSARPRVVALGDGSPQSMPNYSSGNFQPQQQQGLAFSPPGPTQPQQQFASAGGSPNLPVGDPWQEQQFSSGQLSSGSFPCGQHFPSFSSLFFPESFNHGRSYPSFASLFSPYGYNQPLMPGPPFHPMGEAGPPHYNDAPSTHTARGQRRRNRFSPGSFSDTSPSQTDQSYSPPPHHSVSFQARTGQQGQTQAGFSTFPPNLATSSSSPPQPANNVLTHNPVSKQIFNPNTTLTVSNHVYITPPPGDGVFTKSYVNKLQCAEDSGWEAPSRYVHNGVLEGEGGDRGRKKKRNAPPTDRSHAWDQCQHHHDPQSPFCSKWEGGGYTCSHSSSPNRKMSFGRMSPQPHEQSNPAEQGEELELAENFSCNNKPFGQHSTANQSQGQQNVPVACEDPRFYDPSPSGPQIDSIQHNVLPDIVGWVPFSQYSVPNTEQSFPVSQGGGVKQPPSSDSESTGSSQYNDGPYEKRVVRKHRVTISMKPASENKLVNSHRGKEEIPTVTQGTQFELSDIPELPRDQLASKVSEQHREAASSMIQKEKRENCFLPEPLRQQWAEEINQDSCKHVDEKTQKDACQIPELLRQVPAEVSSTQPISPAKDRVSTDVAQETQNEKDQAPELIRQLVDMEEISLACRAAEDNTAVSAYNAEFTCSATNEKAPTISATNERVPTSSATNEKAPPSSATNERAYISNATNERAYISSATNERPPISSATNERPPISNATNERAYISNATNERAYISNATNERAPISSATNERPPISNATNERAYISSATNERAPPSSATNERAYISSATNERPPISNATNERAYISSATNERAPPSSATNERAYISNATNERAYISSATNERPPISSATNERAYTSSATNESAPISNATNERAYISNATNERAYISSATNERAYISNATNERAPPSSATNERAYISSATNERAYTSSATNESAPISSATNERAPISNATNERAYTSSATNERAPISNATHERAYTSSATNENTPTSVAQGPTCCIPELLRRLAASEASQQPTNTATQHLISNAGIAQSVSVTASSGVSPGGRSETGYSAEPFHQLSSRNTVDAQWLQFHHMKKTEKLKQKIQNLKEQQRDLIGRVRTDCLDMVDQEVKSKDAQLQEERIAKARLKEAIVSLQKQLTDMERESWKATLSAGTAQQHVAGEKLNLENQLGNVQTEAGMMRAEKEDLAAKLEAAQARKSELETQLNEAKFSGKEKEVLSGQQAIAITNYKNLVELCHEKYQEQRDTASRLQSQLDHITIKLEERDQESDTLRTQLDTAKTVITKRRRQLQQLKMMQIELRQQYQQEQNLSDLAIKEKKAVEDKLHLETSRYSSLLSQVKTQNKRLVSIRSRVESLDPNRLKQQFEIRYRAKVDLVLRQVGDILDHRSAVVEAAEMTQQEMDFRQRAHESNVQMLLQRNQQLIALQKAASSEARLHHDISTAQTIFAEQGNNDFTCVSNTPNFTFPETILPSRYSAKVQVPTRDTTEHSHLLSHPKATAGFDKGRVSPSAAQQREPTAGGNTAERDNLEIRLRALKMKVAMPPTRYGYHVAKSESRSYLATIRPYTPPQFTAVPTANSRDIPKAPYQIITPGTPVDLLPQSDQWHVSHIASFQPLASYPDQFPLNTEPYLGPTCFATPPTKPYTVLVASGVYNPTHGASNTNGSGESSSGTSETSREESTTSENVSEVPSQERQVSNAPSPARTLTDMPTSENRKKKKARNDKDSRNRRKGSSSGQDSAANRGTVSFNTSHEPEIATVSAPRGQLHRLHSDQNFSSPMMTPEAKRAYQRRRATEGDTYKVSEPDPQGPEMHPAQSDQGLSSAGRVAIEEQSSIPPERRGTYTIPANSAFPQQTVDQDENVAQRSAEEAVSSQKESGGGPKQKESRKGSPGKKSPKHPWTEKSQRGSSVDGDPFKAGVELGKQTTPEPSASDRRAKFRAMSDQTQTSGSFHSGSFEYVSSDLNLAPLQDDFRSSSDLEPDDRNVKPTPVAPGVLQGNGASQQSGMLVLQTPKDDSGTQKDLKSTSFQKDERELAYQLTAKSSASTQISSMRSTGTTFHGAPNAPAMSSTNGPPKPQGKARGTQSVATTQTGHEVWFSDFQETVAIQTSDMDIRSEDDSPNTPFIAVQTSLQKVTSGSSIEREAPSIKSKKRKPRKKTKSALKKKRQSSAERKKQLETPTTVSAQDLKAALPGQLEGSELKLSFSTTTQVSMRFTSSGISTTSSRLSDSRQSPPSYCLPSGRLPASPSSRPSTLHHKATASSSVRIHQQLSSHAGLWRMLESIEQQVQHISTQASTHLQILRGHDLRNLEGYAPSPVERGVAMAASAAIQLSQGDYTDPLPSNGVKESVIKPTKEDKKLRFNEERSPMNLTDAQRVSHASATIALGSPFTEQSGVRSGTRYPQQTGQDGTLEMSASCKSALSADGQALCVTVSSETRLKNTRQSTVEQQPRQAELRLKADAQAMAGDMIASPVPMQISHATASYEDHYLKAHGYQAKVPSPPVSAMPSPRPVDPGVISHNLHGELWRELWHATAVCTFQICINSTAVPMSTLPST